VLANMSREGGANASFKHVNHGTPVCKQRNSDYREGRPKVEGGK
jgi:hypothetical protein